MKADDTSIPDRPLRIRPDTCKGAVDQGAEWSYTFQHHIPGLGCFGVSAGSESREPAMTFTAEMTKPAPQGAFAQKSSGAPLDTGAWVGRLARPSVAGRSDSACRTS